MTYDQSPPATISWPGRRGDIVAALERLATISPSSLNEWPDLKNAIHCLVDDTFWDEHPPSQEIGLLLHNETEAKAIDRVLRPLLTILDALGPVGSHIDYLNHDAWPEVSVAARSAADLLAAADRRT